MLELQNISVTYKNRKHEIQAVKNVSLQINQGEIYGIVGTSGAGKSTLLRTINLLEKPTSGKVLIDGIDISSLRGEALRKQRLNIGMIFQHFNLIRGKTVFENIAFAMKAAKKPKEEIHTRVLALLEMVGLSDKKDAYVSQLSGGQKQRVGIARALANGPNILLCDEPTSALDLETTQSILQLLREINRSLKITIVIISHEMDVVKSICDRVAVMKAGQVIEEGLVYDVFAAPTEEFTKQLVQHTLHLELPVQVFQSCTGKILKVIYKGNSATEPILSKISKQFSVQVNILHGKIEYIGDQALGVLVVGIEGQAAEVEKAISYINKQNIRTEVLHAS